MSDPIRVLLAKSTMDCHDRGVRYLARKLRDAGFEVIFANFLIADELIQMALEEDAQVVGVSSSSGGHMPILEDLTTGMKAQGMDDILLIVGGVIPKDDEPILMKWGVEGVFGPGSKADDLIDLIHQSTGQATESAA